ncbi:type II secretion system protein, partial [Candidatus Saccharibacteria bacterium]|nr:type II secretion system protein [Candidatus Saccharibacteria bacterium]
MSKRQIQTKAGFTIIEVVLVLAIAGLIFMMVFLALPALQRSQRDTQRADDIARLQAAINSYQANNRGRLP